MDIFLSVNNRQQILKLPHVPDTFSISKPQKNEVFDTVTQGELKLIGPKGLESITIASFFPIRDYPFLRDRSYTGYGYAKIIDSWMEKQIPIRLIITKTPINLSVVIDNFEYGSSPGGDINYTLTLSEFKMIQLSQRRV